MLFLLWLTARLLTRLLVIPSGAGDGSGDSWSDAGQWACSPRRCFSRTLSAGGRESSRPASLAVQPFQEAPMVGNIVAIVLLGLLLLVGLGLVLVVVVVVGGALLEVISRGRGRRPPSSYRRQLLARERGRHRRRRRRGSNAHGITIFLDTLPPEAKRRP